METVGFLEKTKKNQENPSKTKNNSKS